MGPQHSIGVSNRLCFGATPTTSPHPPTSQSQLIQEELSNLTQKHAIKLLEYPLETGFYSNIFLVPKKSGGQRLVINLKALNQFVHPEHFKMEGIHTLRYLLRPVDWLRKIDLKDANLVIPNTRHTETTSDFNLSARHTTSCACQSDYSQPPGLSQKH